MTPRLQPYDSAIPELSVRGPESFWRLGIRAPVIQRTTPTCRYAGAVLRPPLAVGDRPVAGRHAPRRHTPRPQLAGSVRDGARGAPEKAPSHLPRPQDG